LSDIAGDFSLHCVLQNASLALGPLVITPERYEVIDFTQVFEVARLLAVVRRVPRDDQSLLHGPLQFVRPLSGSVWTLLGVVFVATTILLYTVDRLDGTASHPSSLAATEMADVPAATRIGLCQSAACALATMMLMTRYSPPTSSSTSAVAEPRSAAGRLTVAALWAFSLIVVVCYVANMAALMTSARLPAMSTTGSPTGDVVMRRSLLSDLRSGRLCLAVSASSVHDVRALLSNSGDDVITDDVITDDVTTKLVADLEDGIRSSECAVVGDSEVLWYHLRRHRTGADDSKPDTVVLHSSTEGAGYAIGVTKGFAHTTTLNLALTRLANDGTLRALRRKLVDIICLL